MRLHSIYKITGWLSVIIGVAATLCISRINWMYYAVALAIAGLVLSITNIFLNAKYFSEDEKIPKGYFGMFMSSLPVIFMMLIIFKFRKG
jgi:hypothetical protein